MLLDLSDVSSVGPKMAIALITTFYGTVLANLIFIPITVKLKRRSTTEALDMSLILEDSVLSEKVSTPGLCRMFWKTTSTPIMVKRRKRKGTTKARNLLKLKERNKCSYGQDKRP